MDRITIHDLELWTHIGVPEAERQTEQRLLLTCSLFLDTRAAGESDSIEDTINYSDVRKALLKLAEEEHKTIERFAAKAAESILKFERVEQTEVTVQKFVLPGTRAVSLTIHRP